MVCFNLKLFALSSNQELALKRLQSKSVFHLENLQFVTLQMVRFRSILKSLFVVFMSICVFLQSTSSPVNDNLMEILIKVPV